MKQLVFSRADTLLDGIYVELVRSIYTAIIPSFIMTIGFIACGMLIAGRADDHILGAIVGVGALTGIARLVVMHHDSKEAFAPQLTAERAQRLEHRFGIAYLAFALCLGAFGVRVFMLSDVGAHMLAVCLLVGYGAGVSAGIALRPRLAIVSMIVGIVPGIIAAFAAVQPYHWATAALMTGFLAGGIRSLLGRYAFTVKEIGRRVTFGYLARRDVLTGLPNRLALREWFEEYVTLDRDGGLVALHCLDLDGFKGVNDMHGHPVGDLLLSAVGKRLTHTLRSTDFVARLGGDEFAVVQRGINDPDEAHLLARRIRAALRQPFRLDGITVNVSASIGFVLSYDRADDIEPLISRADAALYTAKRQGGGIFCHSVEEPVVSLPAVA